MGIGEALARALAKSGASLILISRSEVNAWTLGQRHKIKLTCPGKTSPTH